MTDSVPINRNIQTPRLHLRPFTPADSELLIALDTDPEVMRYLNDAVPFPREEILAHSLPRILAADDPVRGLGFWTAFTRSDNQPIGWAHVRPGRYWPDELELGYRFLRRVWNQGFATETSIALRDYTFNTLGAPKLTAATMRGNEASRRVMVKIGMTFESEFEELKWPGPDKRAVKYACLKKPESRP